MNGQMSAWDYILHENNLILKYIEGDAFPFQIFQRGFTKAVVVIFDVVK
jgi:hypothetical protein